MDKLCPNVPSQLLLLASNVKCKGRTRTAAPHRRKNIAAALTTPIFRRTLCFHAGNLRGSLPRGTALRGLWAGEAACGGFSGQREIPSVPGLPGNSRQIRLCRPTPQRRYQSGAEQFAKANGIILYELRNAATVSDALWELHFCAFGFSHLLCQDCVSNTRCPNFF